MCSRLPGVQREVSPVLLGDRKGGAIQDVEGCGNDGFDFFFVGE